MNDRGRAERSIVVIGGGASGVLFAIHLLSSTQAQVILVEKRDRIGQGLAYSTRNPEHILNVNTFGMSAFPEDREHFWNWLQAAEYAHLDDPLDFAPRFAYGDYLEAVLGDLTTRHPGRLTILNALCTDLREEADGVVATLEGGDQIVADAAVLATGHEETPARTHGLAITLSQAGDIRPAPDAPVMILGTGLSMVDTWLSLTGQGHRGTIRVLSRHGLLPLRHERVTPLTIDEADVPLGQSPAVFTRWVRALVASTVAKGGDWRSVIDGLRPYNQRIWQGWSATQRRQFLTHLRPIWNVHRHRLPPQVFDRIQQAIAAGQLEIIAGHFLGLDPAPSGVRVTFRRRGEPSQETVEVAHFYDCGGMALDIAGSSNPLLASLVAAGTLHADPVRIGPDVSPDGALIGASGKASDRIFALGPLMRGALFEIEAVPDIRVAAQNLALHLGKTL